MNNTHSKLVGYILWILGFMGLHRFYYGKPITGILWLCTLGLLGIGWLVDLFLIPAMDNEADKRFKAGRLNYSLAWLLMAFLGVFGAHRLYLGKWKTAAVMAIVSLSCGSLMFLLPPILLALPFVAALLVYDFCTLNTQIDVINRA